MKKLAKELERLRKKLNKASHKSTVAWNKVREATKVALDADAEYNSAVNAYSELFGMRPKFKNFVPPKYDDKTGNFIGAI
jgi:hypothetical protein